MFDKLNFIPIYSYGILNYNFKVLISWHDFKDRIEEKYINDNVIKNKTNYCTD